MRRARHRTHDGDGDALAAALARADWERAALLLLLGVSMAARMLPEGAIDDVLAVLGAEEEHGEREGE